MNTFKKGQIVLHDGVEYFFSGVSGRGGKGEFCFLWLKGAESIQGKQVKISELKAL